MEANLVNYLWPLLIVVLAPLFLPGWVRPHVGGALVGFAGAAIAILGGRRGGGLAWGYLPPPGRPSSGQATRCGRDASPLPTAASACSGWCRASVAGLPLAAGAFGGTVSRTGC